MKFFKKMLHVTLVSSLLVAPLHSVVYAQSSTSTNDVSAEDKFIEALQASKVSPIESETGNQLVRVIVQTDQAALIDGGSESNYQELKNKILQLAPSVIFKEDFSYLVSGFSMDIPEKHVAALSSIKGIKKVSIARRFYETMSNASGMTEATTIWRDRNYKGEGMVVAIIDSGIDVTHKDMRLSDSSTAKIQTVKEGFTIKVPFGYNYADGSDIVKDNDTIGKSMHGMHVAGIVAANATDEDLEKGSGIRGVAPEAQLLAMKVFSNNSDVSGAYEDAIVAAIEDSVKYGADIINMSLGTDNGFATPEDPEHIAIQKAREAGVLVVVSAGNAALSTTSDDHSRIPLNTLGFTDNTAVGSPSTGEYALSVASANNTTETGYVGTLQVASGATDFVFVVAGYQDKWDRTKAYEVVDVGLGTSLDYDGKQVEGKVVFVTRGDITFSEKFSEAINHGAVGLIVANNVDGDFGMAGIDEYTVPSVTVSKEVGELLKQKIQEGNATVKVDFHDKDFTGSNEVSSFTSYGPSPELEFKPEVMAPGGNIYSTVNNNRYSKMSGTSMAAPHVSGLLALMLGTLKQEGFSVDDIQRFSQLSLVNTATPFEDTAGNTGLPVSPRRQGAGMANVEKAIQNRVLITEESGKATKALKEMSGVHTFTLKLTNYGSVLATYAVDLSVVLTEVTDESTKYLTARPLANATVSTSVSSVTVPAGGTATVQVTVDVSAVTGNQFAEGFIYFKSDDAVDLVFPYMGFVGDWGAETILDKPKSDPDSVYDTLGLVSGGSYLGSTFDYMTFSETINPDKVGFSPNGDDNYDSVNLVLGLLRSAKTLDVDVVAQQTETAESLAHLTTTKDVRKPLYLKKDMVSFTNGYWDGKVFNEQTGEYEPLADGQYYMRLKAGAASTVTPYQYTYLPFKIDTKKPSVEILSQGYEGDEYVVQFKATDNEGGIGLPEDGVGAYVDDDGKTTIYDDEDGDVDGVYTFRIERTRLEDGKQHTITIGAIDEVFNVKTEVIVLDAVAVLFDNIPEAPVGLTNRYYSKDDGTFKLQGHVGSQVASLTVNGQVAEIEDGSFTVQVPLSEGNNDIHFVVKDANGAEVAASTEDTKFVITKDTTPPVIEITSPDVTQLQKLSSNKIHLTGRVSDTSQLPVSVRAGFTNFTVNEDGTFSGEATVDWTRTLKIVARDKAGNETTIELKTVFEDSETSAFSIFMTSGVGTFNYINGNSKLVENGNLLKLDGHVNKSIRHLVIGGVVVPVDEGLRFSYRYPLKEVNNHIDVQAIGTDGSVLYEGSYAVYYDKTAPNITIEGPGTIEDDVIYTNANPYVVTATASDNGHGYRLFINGDEVLNYDYMASSGAAQNTQVGTYQANAVTGNTLLVELSDVVGNAITKRYTFVYDDVAPVISVEGLTSDGELLTPGTLTANTDEPAIVEMSVDGQVYNGESILAPGSYTLTVRATDKAGNVTEQSYPFVVVETDKTAPAERDIPAAGIVTVTHVYQNASGEEVERTQELLSGLAGEAYTTQAQLKDGYHLVSVNGRNEGKFIAFDSEKEETHLKVVYVYQQNSTNTTNNGTSSSDTSLPGRHTSGSVNASSDASQENESSGNSDQDGSLPSTGTAETSYVRIAFVGVVVACVLVYKGSSRKKRI